MKFTGLDKESEKIASHIEYICVETRNIFVNKCFEVFSQNKLQVEEMLNIITASLSALMVDSILRTINSMIPEEHRTEYRNEMVKTIIQLTINNLHLNKELFNE